MKRYEDFAFSGHSFSQMVGDPDELSAAIGRVVVNFAHLEDEMTRTVTRLLRITREEGEIVCAEMAFKTKVHVAGSLFRQLLPTWQFNTGTLHDPVEVVGELMSSCFRAEELRNRIIHSSWADEYFVSGQGERLKVSAKAARGLRRESEKLTAGQMLDIADYVIYVANMVEEMFLVFEQRA